MEKEMPWKAIHLLARFQGARLPGEERNFYFLSQMRMKQCFTTIK